MRGVSPVLEVPFHPDESVDLDGFSDVVAHVLGTGVTSVMFPGFASEFHKLADDERRSLRDRLLDQTRARTDVAAIVAVQDHATAVAVRRAVEAVEAGTDAINLLPPYLLGPSPAAVRAHVRAVLSAVAPAPVVLQYAPAQTGTSLDAGTIASIASDHPNLAAVKVESTPPGALIAALARTTPALPSFVGYAGLQLPDALRRGAIGVQPGCSFTELYVRFWRLWQAGDEPAALSLHQRMLPYLSYWMQSVELIVAAEKLISLRRGLIRSATCRAPAHALDDGEIQLVDAFLQEFGPELASSVA
ncbi:dihydrodipicolinate synthase family protein [Actinomadura darangshiensis]|uniref:Dihydrodipicolinate synthase family protein n=1 Tax=Actinomadura darangshiensis TaxID=705336 RepID=A0A4R5BU35_9ACTN|nr:dihydrodipicolinate synthase family protein [Actinomadura darangshiensis]